MGTPSKSRTVKDSMYVPSISLQGSIVLETIVIGENSITSNNELSPQNYSRNTLDMDSQAGEFRPYFSRSQKKRQKQKAKKAAQELEGTLTLAP